MTTRDGRRAVPVWDALVGRDDELSQLRSLVKDVAAGRGRAVWVDGEPGIGKSALLASGLTGADELGCQVFRASADESGSVFPLRVLLDALRIRPDASDPTRAEIAERLWGRNATGAIGPGDRIAAAAEWLLILIDRLCADGPVVLATDDLQWADDMSLAVLGRLRRATEQLPLLLVAAARPVPQREQVDVLRHNLADMDGVMIRLGPLDEPQVDAVVRRLLSGSPGPNLRAQLAQAAGNPLYVRELVDALMIEQRIEVTDGVAEIDLPAAGPATLAAAIAGRLNFLSKPTVRVLRLATLFGGDFRVEQLSPLNGGAVANVVNAIEEGLAAGVLVESGNALGFRHRLIHQALYAAMPASLRSALHRQAAEALDAAGEAVDTVAEQIVAAPQAADAWVVEWLGRAAPTLIYRAPQIAVDLLHRVRTALLASDPHDTSLDGHLVAALSQLGRYNEIEALARPLLGDPATDPKLMGRMAWSLAYALRVLGLFDRALTVVDETLAERSVPEPWTARLQGLRAALLINVGRFDQARAAGALAEVDGERAGDRLALGWALFALAAVQSRYDGDLTAASQTFERATVLLADEPDANDLRLLLLSNRASTLFNLGHAAEADRVIGHALTLAERAGTPQRLATLRVQAAELGFIEGRWDFALAELDAAGDLPPHNPTRLMVLGLTTLIAIHRDDRAVAAAQLREVEDLALPPASLNLADMFLVARAFAAERDGRPGEALERLLGVLDPDSTGTFPYLSPDRCGWLPDVVRLALATDDVPTATAAAGACAAQADDRPLPSALVAAEHCRGLVESDPALLLSAAKGFERLGYALPRANALEDAAFLLAGSGDLAAARRASTDALDIYTSLEADWDIARANARLRPLGIRRGARGARGRPTYGWAALTPTEVKIAYLIEAGMSNPDIAAELFLSRNTVQTHVSHILGKLNARSRVDIVRAAMSQHNDPSN